MDYTTAILLLIQIILAMLAWNQSNQIKYLIETANYHRRWCEIAGRELTMHCEIIKLHDAELTRRNKCPNT